MNFAGIDLGGSKIETRVFGGDFTEIARQRVPTPADYLGLLAALEGAVDWARGQGAGPVGLASAGRAQPGTGRMIAANLACNGERLAADLAQRCGPVPLLNDGAAMVLAEARMGAARGADRVAGLVLGTGIGGALVSGGQLLAPVSGTAGEIGHMPLPAPLVVAEGLPLLSCGCGRTGCAETLVAGPGLARLAETLGVTGPPLENARLRALWLALLAELALILVRGFDPEVIVLAGGLSQVPGLLEGLGATLTACQLEGFPVPDLVLASGGDAAGTLGAALAAATAMEGAPRA